MDNASGEASHFETMPDLGMRNLLERRRILREARSRDCSFQAENCFTQLSPSFR